MINYSSLFPLCRVPTDKYYIALENRIPFRPVGPSQRMICSLSSYHRQPFHFSYRVSLPFQRSFFKYFLFPHRPALRFTEGATLRSVLLYVPRSCAGFNTFRFWQQAYSFRFASNSSPWCTLSPRQNASYWTPIFCRVSPRNIVWCWPFQSGLSFCLAVCIFSPQTCIPFHSRCSSTFVLLYRPTYTVSVSQTGLFRFTSNYCIFFPGLSTQYHVMPDISVGSRQSIKAVASFVVRNLPTSPIIYLCSAFVDLSFHTPLSGQHTLDPINPSKFLRPFLASCRHLSSRLLHRGNWPPPTLSYLKQTRPKRLRSQALMLCSRLTESFPYFLFFSDLLSTSRFSALQVVFSATAVVPFPHYFIQRFHHHPFLFFSEYCCVIVSQSAFNSLRGSFHLMGAIELRFSISSSFPATFL